MTVSQTREVVMEKREVDRFERLFRRLKWIRFGKGLDMGH